MLLTLLKHRPRFTDGTRNSSQHFRNALSPPLRSSVPIASDSVPGRSRTRSSLGHATALLQEHHITESPSRIGSSSRRHRSRRTNLHGLVLVYEPDQKPLADLVFLHAVGGSTQASWTARDTAESLWPSDWLPQDSTLAAVRILTFGYGQSRDDVEALDFSGWAKELLLELRYKTGREDRPLNIGTVPLIFVSHSLGGLLAKKAFLLGREGTNSNYSLIADAVSAFVFLATPHRGAQLVEVLRDVLAACAPESVDRLDLSRLQIHTENLDDINEQFVDLIPYVDTVSFYETQETDVGNSLVLVLRQDFATLGHQMETRISLEASHTSISKPDSDRDVNYRRIRDVLRYLVEKCKGTSVETASNESNEEELIRVMELLGVEEAPEDDHNWFSDKRVHGTCDFVLQHAAFSSWVEYADSRLSALWCYGRAGSGKSVTASHIINSLKDDGRKCAYYYFRSGDQVKNNLTLFLLSIAFQLALIYPHFRRKLCRIADDGFDRNKAGYKLLWKKLFISSFLKTEMDEPIFIVVDGLDELDAALAKELISKLFVELADSRQPLRLLMVSRPTPEIDSAMDRLARHLYEPLKRMPIDGNKEDLELYVQEEMEDMCGDDTFKQQTISNVLSKADGNFLWVHLVVREILDCNMEDDVDAALNTVPQELGPLYQRMDQRLADASRNRPQDKELGRCILTWACCSRYPLLLEELTEALSPEFARIIDIDKTVSRLCGEFIVVDKRHHLSVMHASAREYLISEPDLNYYIQPDLSHQNLFRKCIKKLVLSHASIRQILEKPRGFIKYAAESWPYHLSSSRGWLDQDSLTVLLELFQSRAVLDWICILGHMRRLRVMIDASKALTGFLKIVENVDQSRNPLQRRIAQADQIATWSQDLVRIVGKFGARLLRHPTAIYDLIPAFCPATSAIRQQFGSSNVGSFLYVQGSLSQEWDDCLAKFTIPGHSLPQQIRTLERHFAVLTNNGVVRLYHSTTCEEARSFEHGENILSLAFSTSGERLATAGHRKTKIWDTRTARHLFTIDNPAYTKVLTMSFKIDDDNDEILLAFWDDTCIRNCSLSSTYFTWILEGPCKIDADPHGRANSPRNAQFSPDCSSIAVSYRGVYPSVWYLDGSPRFGARCDRRAAAGPQHGAAHTNYVDAQAFAWHPVSGHLLGIYNDGFVFKWHPTLDGFQMAEIRCNGIKCSADGKLFITSSGDGTLRIWDFEHFEPIYQLFYPNSIRDIDIDRNEARVYDIRENYCHAWQPNALLRILESDDKTSDAKSSHDSAYQISLSEAEQENKEPITALYISNTNGLFVVGDESGQTNLFDFEGKKITSIAEGYMGVEHIAVCEELGVVAIADLGRDVSVTHLDGAKRSKLDVLPIVLSVSDSITQILFNADGTLLCVVTASALCIYQTGSTKLVATYPEPRPHYWLNHPVDKSVLLGFGGDQVRILLWEDVFNSTSYLYDRPAGPDAVPFLRADSRRPSEAYPMSPSETYAVPEKVFVSTDRRRCLVQSSCSTTQSAHKTDYFLVDLKHLEQAAVLQRMPTRSLPANILKSMHIALGFVAVDHNLISQSRRSSTAPMLTTRRSVNRPQFMEQTFAFIDHDFWVCTVNVGAEDGRQCHVNKHFFLPSDWQNSEWIKLASVNSAGSFFCPRNGEVAIVSHGLAWEWTDGLR